MPSEDHGGCGTEIKVEFVEIVRIDRLVIPSESQRPRFEPQERIPVEIGHSVKGCIADGTVHIPVKVDCDSTASPYPSFRRESHHGTPGHIGIGSHDAGRAQTAALRKCLCRAHRPCS